MKKKVIVTVICFFLVAAFALLLIAAGEKETEGKVIKLAYASPYVGHEFWSDVQRGIEETAANMPGVEVTVVTSHEDAVAQIAQFETFIASKVDAILLAPTDFTALSPAVEEANRRGIPVIGVDPAQSAAVRHDHDGALIAQPVQRPRRLADPNHAHQRRHAMRRVLTGIQKRAARAVITDIRVAAIGPAPVRLVHYQSIRIGFFGI